MKVPLWVVLTASLVLALAVILTRAVPYWIILPFTVGWLASRYVSSPAASERSKQVVVLVTVWATAMASALPLAVIPAVVALSGVGVFILVHHDITTPGT